MIDEKWVLVAAALNMAGGFTYLVGTLKGVTKPNRVTWLLWAAIPLVAAFAQLDDGVSWPVVVTVAVSLSPAFIFVASFHRPGSSWQLGRIDYVCGGLALLGVVLWQSTNAVALAILFSIMADAVAAVPTLVKAYRAPETESWSAYGFGAMCGVLTLFTINSWDFVQAGFAVYYTVLCLTLIALIRFNPHWHFPHHPVRVAR